MAVVSLNLPEAPDLDIDTIKPDGELACSSHLLGDHAETLRRALSNEAARRLPALLT